MANMSASSRTPVRFILPSSPSSFARLLRPFSELEAPKVSQRIETEFISSHAVATSRNEPTYGLAGSLFSVEHPDEL